MSALSPPSPITTARELDDAIAAMSQSSFIALDTEFMREKTYYPKLCLIQLGTASHTFLVDPLAIDDLSPMLSFLSDRTRLKVLHAGRQDIEVLFANQPGEAGFGLFFDTQIAAGLLGLPAQIGYGELVSKRLGHTLAKGHARTDWLARPLSPEQLTYAADDVIYLVPLFAEMKSALHEKGRLHWMEEECARMEDPALYRTEPEEAWQRFKGLERLDSPQRGALKALAAWRERLAATHDKPRGWILADDAVRALADRLPTSVQALEGVPALPPGTVRKHGADLVRIITEGAERGDPEFKLFQRPSNEQTSRVTKLMDLVRREAEQLQISPELLATRRDVEQLVFRDKRQRFEHGWRAEVIGRTVLERNEALQPRK